MAELATKRMTLAELHDRRIKLPAYRQIESVKEILLLDSQTIYTEILRRQGDLWITELVQGPDGLLRLSSGEISVSMAELYEGLDIEDEAAAAPANP